MASDHDNDLPEVRFAAGGIVWKRQNGAAKLASDPGSLASSIFTRRSPKSLRTLHPDDSDPVLGHTKERSDTPSHPIRLHVIGIDRHLAVRRIRHGVRWTDRGMPLERYIVICLNNLGRTCHCHVWGSYHNRTGTGRGHRAAHVLEQVIRRREGRSGRLLPVRLKLSGRVDGLLFAFADDGDIVALADDLHETWNAFYRGLVDADERRAGKRRPDVARRRA